MVHISTFCARPLVKFLGTHVRAHAIAISIVYQILHFICLNMTFLPITISQTKKLGNESNIYITFLPKNYVLDSPAPPT